MAGIRATLERYRVRFDHWFLEASLYEGEPSAWDRARERLIADGHAYRTTARCGCARRRSPATRRTAPLVRSNGEPTYLAADVAYHWDKLERGFDRLVNVLGADHHSYVVRLQGDRRRRRRRPGPARGAAAAVRARRRGRRARVDVQAARRLRHARGADRRDRRRRDALVHAVALGRLDGRPRPDARARAVGREPRLLRAVRARADRVGAAPRRARSASRRRWRRRARGSRSSPPSASWSRSCSRSRPRSPRRPTRRAPHRIAAYALEIAQTFTAFYRDCRVVGAEPRGARVVPARALRGDAARDRALARAARRDRAGLDVARAGINPRRLASHGRFRSGGGLTDVVQAAARARGRHARARRRAGGARRLCARPEARLARMRPGLRVRDGEGPARPLAAARSEDRAGADPATCERPREPHRLALHQPGRSGHLRRRLRAHGAAARARSVRPPVRHRRLRSARRRREQPGGP